MKVREVQAKSVLNKSKIFDYCVNAYTGCQINCRYCYARLFMKRYSGHREPWGDFVDVKVNAAERLERQLVHAKRGTVWISSVCDPYQPLEAKYGLTRRCLKELLKRQFPVNIQTKSKLVLRDRDLFEQFEEIQVGMTVTTEDEEVAKLFEPLASSVQERLDALEQIHSAGIAAFAFVGPILPGDPVRLAERLAGRVDKVLVDRMNYVSSVKKFCERMGFEQELTESFFVQYKEILASELAKKGVVCEVLF